MPPKGKKATGAKAGPKSKQSHQLAERFPAGEVLKDILKGEWRLGPVIGSGGFGLIYLASSLKDSSKSENYVVKIEPHSNGPLFSELSFYQRCCKPDMIKQWKSSQRLASLGVPEFIASGSHEKNKTRYRFMVMQRFGSDLQKLFENCNKMFPVKTVLTLGIQMIDALEYIHSKGYAHADIKASNMLLGYGKATSNQAYLVDYGLATKYESDSRHKEYKEDPKRCHDGTIEFTSRDAHKGVAPSRRGDMEILGYCLLQWTCQQLPWEDKLTDQNYVRDQKNKYMSDIPSLLRKCFPTSTPPVELKDYLTYVSKLSYTEQPDYNRCREFFKKAIKHNGLKNDGVLDFSTPKTPSISPRKRAHESPSPVRSAKRRPQAAASASPMADHSSDFSSDGDSPAPSTSTGKKLAAGRKPIHKGKAKRGKVVKAASESAAIETAAMKEVRRAPQKRAYESPTPDVSTNMRTQAEDSPNLSPWSDLSSDEVDSPVASTSSGRKAAAGRKPAVKAKQATVKVPAKVGRVGKAASSVETPAMREVREGKSSCTASPLARQAMLASSESTGLTNGTSSHSSSSRDTVPPRAKKPKVSVAVQTSPHLKGLRGKRSRKDRK